MNAVLWGGLLLGLAGSLHCAGMCGPIALALPMRGAAGWHHLRKNLAYQGGRILTYTLLGGLFGLIGHGFAMGGIHQWVSLILGAMLMLSVFLPRLWKKPVAGGRWLGWLKARLAMGLGPQGRLPLFAVGMLNGLLPCGLVYVALGGALAAGDTLTSAAFMALFGLGTSPLMASLVWMGAKLGPTIRQRIKHLVPVTVFLLGMLFFVRGLGLEIPYISPANEVLQVEAPAGASCH